MLSKKTVFIIEEVNIWNGSIMNKMLKKKLKYNIKEGEVDAFSF